MVLMDRAWLKHIPRHQNRTFIFNIDKVIADFIYLPLRLLAMSGANLAAILDFLAARKVENA